MILVSALGPNPSFFLFWGTFIQLGGLLGQGPGLGLGPGLDNKGRNLLFLKEFLQEMQSSVKVSDRLSEDPEDNSYINKMPLPKVRVWIRYRARAIAGVKGNFRHSHVNDMSCRLCSQDSDETQEHLLLCEGTRFERRGLDLSDWRGLLDFWRRMKFKMAAVT